MKIMPRPVPVERRSRVRFPLDLRVRYRTLGRGEPITGEGWVLNVSSGGVLVAYRDEIRAGTPMELNIEWPSLLDGRVPLQLVMLGRVVRCELSGLAVALSRYSFRTTRTTVTPIDASVGALTPMVHRVASA